MKIIFVADFFIEQVLGGGELNNEEFINIVRNRGTEVIKIQSHLVNAAYIEANSDYKFIVANFMNLSPKSRVTLQKYSYVIYEHDHKYLKTRNPQDYKDFKAPPDQIINYDFYKNAKGVLCQSKFHCDIVKLNLNLENIVNLSGNLWSLESLDLMKKFLKKAKSEKCSIMDSPIPHKNTRQAVRFCQYKNKDYELIKSSKYEEFLNQLSNNKSFIFFPRTPETLSRVIVETRMMGMSVITNELVGAANEDWYLKKGSDLIKEVETMRERIPECILERLSVS